MLHFFLFLSLFHKLKPQNKSLTTSYKLVKNKFIDIFIDFVELL
jgi:hypothetical protein